MLSFAFVSMFVLSGCFQREPLAQSEYYEPWMDKFFEYILFSQQGAYTLNGSKPMTYIEVCLYSRKEILEIHKKLGIVTDEQNSNIVDINGFIEGWKKWQYLKDKLYFPRFILVDKRDKEYSKLYHMYLVNVLEAALAIKENYSLFKSVLGFDFDPLEVVFEIKDQKSRFWEIVFSRSDLIGILYGFGLKNSQCFSWSFGESVSENFEVPDSFKDSLFQSSAFSSEGIFNGRESVKDLKIPTFRSYQEDDPVIRKYEEERKKIQSLYSGKSTGRVAIETLLK